MKPTAALIGKPIKTKKRLADPNTKAVIAALETVTCLFCWMTPPSSFLEVLAEDYLHFSVLLHGGIVLSIENK